MEVLTEEKPIRRVRISWETSCISSNQVQAINDILQLLFLDSGLNNDESLEAVITVMKFHKIDEFTLECDPFSYYLKTPTGE